jgi:hypothetical protein
VHGASIGGDGLQVWPGAPDQRPISPPGTDRIRRQELPPPGTLDSGWSSLPSSAASAADLRASPASRRRRGSPSPSAPFWPEAGAGRRQQPHEQPHQGDGAPGGDAADGYDEPDPARVEAIRRKPASELSVEELELDARARVRRRQLATARAGKARRAAGRRALAATQEALRSSVLGASVHGLGGLGFTDLLAGSFREDSSSGRSAASGRETAAARAGEEGAAERGDRSEVSLDSEAAWLQPGEAGLARVYHGLGSWRAVALECAMGAEPLLLGARRGWHDLGLANCGRAGETAHGAMHAGGWRQHMCVCPMVRRATELLGGRCWDAAQTLALPPAMEAPGPGAGSTSAPSLSRITQKTLDCLRFTYVRLRCR